MSVADLPTGTITRLALRVAADQLDRVSDGVYAMTMEQARAYALEQSSSPAR